jgi:hypothetical protein
LQLKLAVVIECIDDQPQLFLDFIRCPVGYGFFFGWASVCFGCSGVAAGLCSRTIPFPGNVRADDLLSKLLQIEFDIRDSLFQGFVFVWHMFVPI